MKRTRLIRKTPLDRGTKRLQQRTPMKKVGPRTREWLDCIPPLKAAFKAAGITSCEIRREGCWHSIQGFAHSCKRRHIPRRSALLLEVIGACNYCHDIIENWGEKRMSSFVRAVIASRQVPVVVNLSKL